MQLTVSIPVEKVKCCKHYYTYRCEDFVCAVVRVLRTRATQYKHLNRWHYFADVVAPPQALPDSLDKSLTHNGLQLYRTNIFRGRQHKGWKPPAFSDGSGIAYIENAAQEVKP